jgi:glycosyltransferase involved in cell wall biosynthesis
LSSSSNSKSDLISVVIPLHNEALNVKLMGLALTKALKDLNYEILFVNDGSTDDTSNQLKKLNEKSVTVIELDKNYGQSSAIAAGIDFSKGNYIVTLDGDLQNDPYDIPWMLEILKNKSLDLIAGFRKERKDPFFKKIPSIIANYIIQILTKTKIKDNGCALKIFNESAAKKLMFSGEIHRYITTISFLNGLKIMQVPVNHMPRKFGKSKYGLSRTFKVIYDICLIILNKKYSNQLFKSKEKNYSVKNIY